MARIDPRRRVDHFTSAELDEMARVTPETIAEAQRWWEEGADPAFRTILNADEEPSDDAPPL